MFFCLFERICGQAGESFFLFTLLNRADYEFPTALEPDFIFDPDWGSDPFRACGPNPHSSSPRTRGPRDARTGKQKENRGETQSPRSPRTWVPACAGMTESAIVFGPQGEKFIKTAPQILSKNLLWEGGRPARLKNGQMSPDPSGCSGIRVVPVRNKGKGRKRVQEALPPYRRRARTPALP